MNNLELYKRRFTIISFTHRLGTIYRRDKEEFILSTADDCAGIVTRKVRAQTAQSRFVLVFERGLIKADWSRIDARTFHLLTSLSIANFTAFLRNLQVSRTFATPDEFGWNIAHSFSQYVKASYLPVFYK